MRKSGSWIEAAIALAVLLACAGTVPAAELPAPPIPSFSPEAQAQREAASLRQEGDHQQEEGNLKEAREKWLAALDAYRRSGYKAGEPGVLFLIGASYQAEAAVDIQKQKLTLVYTIQASLAGAELLEGILRREEPKALGSFQQADILLKQASDLAATGDCVAAVPFFLQAGESSGRAGWAQGEVGSLVGRLRCIMKSDDFTVLMTGGVRGIKEFLSLSEKLKPQIQIEPQVLYLKAIGEDQLGNLKDAESDYRTVLQESLPAVLQKSLPAGDLLTFAQTALDLGGLLARSGNLAEAEGLFRLASKGFAVLQGPDSRRNQAAAMQNLAGVNLATGRIDAAITAYQQALELWKPLEEKSREAEALRALSSAFRQKGDDASAKATLAEAEKLEVRPVTNSQAGTPGKDPGIAEQPSRDAESGKPGPVLSAEGAMFNLSPRAQAQREATLLLGEGDRLLQAGNLRQARDKWQASAEAFKRAVNHQGVAKCYRRLGDSYVAQVLDDRKRRLGMGYYNQMLTEVVKEAEESQSGDDSHLHEEDRRRAGSLLDQSSELVDRANCTQALPLIAEARSLYQRVGLAFGEVRSLQLRMLCEDSNDSLTTLEESLSILVALPVREPPSELALKGGELLSLGRQADALALYQELLCRYEQAKDAGGIVSTLRELGGVQDSMGDFAAAEWSLSRALTLLSANPGKGARFEEAAAHTLLGDVYATTGLGNEAVIELWTGLSLWRELGQLEWEALSLSALGLALSDLGDFSGAFDALDEAEKIQRKLSPNPALEGNLLNYRGKVYYSQGRYQEAGDAFEKARALYRSLSNRWTERSVLINLGMIEKALGHFSKALSSFRQVRDIAHQLGATGFEVMAEMDVASALSESGDFQAAIQNYLSLLPEATGRGEEGLVSKIRGGLGAAYLGLGELDQADFQLTQALDTAYRLGNREDEANALTERGRVRSQAGKVNLAKVDLQNALKIWRNLGNEVMVNRVLGNLGVQNFFGKFSEEDLQVFQRSLESSQKAGLNTDSLSFSLLLGFVCFQRGDLAGAIERFSQALAEADRIGDSARQYVGRAMLMVSHYLQGDSKVTLRDLDEVVASLDRRQSGLTLSELKSPFLAQFFNVYAFGVLLNAENGRPEEAFRYAEQARARAFRDQIGNQRIEVRRGADPELIWQERELRAQLAHLAKAIQNENATKARKEERIDSLKRAQEEAQSDYTTLLIRLKLANPEYAALVSVRALSLQEIQQQALDEQTTLIEYFVPNVPEGQESSPKALAWVIDHDHFTMIQLPVTASQLENQIAYIRDLIATRNAVQAQEAELYLELFAPLAPHVRRRNLIIVPHGVLHSLPFAALWDEETGRFLGDAYALSYAPSATVLKFARAKKARAVGPVLVAGNPDGSLPRAAEEARAVARLYGDEPLLGRAATKSAVVARAGQAGILHLAAHADLNQVNPLFTRIKLAPDGEQGGDLEMNEVFGLDLSKTGLVVLSGCSTQRGKLSAGDELEGLTRAFLYAGTPAVVSSLWEVSDESTSFFMENFYRHLQKGAGRAESLRLAQMETRKRFPDPYQWAAFVLTGDGR